jgi:two-component system NtrC family sensor kinase
MSQDSKAVLIKKVVLCALFVMFMGRVSAQRVAPVVFDSIGKDPMLLDKGWRFSPVDNPAFAQSGYNDASWDTINPGVTLDELPQIQKIPVGWLRMHFKTGPGLLNIPLALGVEQSAASEVYLDGKLLVRYGTVSARPEDMVPIGVNLPWKTVYLEPGIEHLLAVRFSPYQHTHNNVFFTMVLAHPDTYIEGLTYTHDYRVTYILLSAVFFILSLLHLAFYRYDASQKANLFFALYTIISMLGFACMCVTDKIQHIQVWENVYYAFFILILLGSIWCIHALASLFGFRLKKVLLFLWCLYALDVCLLLFVNIDYSFLLGIIVFSLFQLWIMGKALKEKKRGAGIIATGFAISLIAAVVLMVTLYGQNDIWFSVALVLLVFMGPALGISLYLAREFALNSNLLRKKLVQIEGLSAQNLLQEQEKQQMLETINETLENQVIERTAQLQLSITELKQTQGQLIQSEKMASLGELTAGIAHEIQNPLNFVNNFSDVSVELLQELKDEVAKGDFDEVNAIADDVIQNLEKIAHHGRRADNIVKGMLQHSRASSGQKEPTDINVLTDEYLRLAYHGLRAKDKSFNADLVTHFGEGLPNISVIPQDVGRVLLNLFTNAFYATQLKSKQWLVNSDQSGAQAITGYNPVVEVTTQVKGNSLEIIVKDNGTGIPDAIKDKILQPFFTTKPTGEGTGLGLSLSYDIIVKGHGGSIDIESVEGQGAVFKILLPIHL